MRAVTGLYGFCALVGGVLTLFVLAGGDHDAHGAFHGDHTGPFGSLLSFRTIVFALAFFGLTGLLLPLVGAGTITTFAAASVIGAFTGYLNGRLIGYLNRTGGGEIAPAQSYSGARARVMVPVTSGQRGRVSIEREGRTTSLVAEPFRAGAGPFPTGATVVVVEVQAGVAKVAALDLPADHDA